MKGLVTLLGAGPGDMELLTILGKRRLEQADVIVYDHLVNPDLLSYARTDAELTYVGKRPYQKHISQDEINELMVKMATAGKRVVRLKAGDPYVFGRGGEEAQYLKEHNVAFEVVPGLTSAITGLAAAGIPITHRDFASSFHVITAHQTELHPLDWPTISKMEGTLVFLMGVAQLSVIVSQLTANGMATNTPVAVIQWATQWRQKTGLGSLADIEEVVKTKQIGSPALIVIGGVVSLSETLSVHRPLERKHVLMPFTPHKRTHDLLADAGASIDFFNLGTNASLPVTLPDFSNAGRLVIGNLTAFEFLKQQMISAGFDLRVLQGWQLVALNGLIQKRLKQQGLLVETVISEDQITSTDWVVGEVAQLAQQHMNSEHQLSTYKQVFKAQTIADSETFDAITVTSQRACNALINGASKQQLDTLEQTPVFTMGQSLQQLLQAAGFKKVTTVASLDQLVDVMKKGLSDD